MDRRSFLKYIPIIVSAAVAGPPDPAPAVKQVGHWIEVDKTLLKVKPLNAAKIIAMENVSGSLSEWMEREIIEHIFGGKMM